MRVVIHNYFARDAYSIPPSTSFDVPILKGGQQVRTLRIKAASATAAENEAKKRVVGAPETLIVGAAYPTPSASTVQATGRQFGQKVGGREAKVITALLRGRDENFVRETAPAVGAVIKQGGKWYKVVKVAPSAKNFRVWAEPVEAEPIK